MNKRQMNNLIRKHNITKIELDEALKNIYDVVLTMTNTRLNVVKAMLDLLTNGDIDDINLQGRVTRKLDNKGRILLPINALNVLQNDPYVFVSIYEDYIKIENYTK